MSKTLIAYCYRGGDIYFGESLPNGALEIARSGKKKLLRSSVEVLARHAWDGRLLVPGVPEAENGDIAVDAVVKFKEWVGKRLSK